MTENQSMDATVGRVYQAITGVEMAHADPACYATPSRLISLLVLLAVALVATLPGWWPGRVMVPTDALKQFSPWANPDNPGYTPGNSALLDQPVQFVPWMSYTVERLKHREVSADGTSRWTPQIPLWNPYTQLGAPFIGNGQSAVFYPTTLLHLGLPPTWSWTISATLRLWLAGVGLWLLAGRHGLSAPGRLLAAIAFMLCGFNVVWLNHPHMNVMPLLPWAVLVTERLIERPSSFRMLAAALLFGWQFVGGHPASSVHLLLTCGLVYVLHLFWLDRWKAAKAIPATVLALVAGFLLAGVQWLPMLDYTGSSGTAAYRQQLLKQEQAGPGQGDGGQKLVLRGREYIPRDGLDYWREAAGRLAFLSGIVFPYANGYPPDRITPFEFRHATRLPNTNEIAAGFVGTVPLVLAMFALVARRKDRRVRLWLAVGIVAALIGVGFPGLDLVISHIPALNVVQNNRLIVTVALALSMLAGIGLDDLLARIRAGSPMLRLRGALRRTAIVLAILALAGAGGLLALKGPLIAFGLKDVKKVYDREEGPNGHEHSWQEVTQRIGRVHTEATLTSLRLLIPATMLAAMAFVLARRSKRLWPWLTIAAVDLLAFAIPYNPGASADTYRPASKTIEYLQAQQKAAPNDPFRFSGIFGSLHPDLAIMYGLQDVRGFDAVTSWRLWRWMVEVDRMAPHRQAEVKRTEWVDRPAYRLLGMRYLIGPRFEEGVHVAPSTQASWWPIEAPEPGVTLYRNDQAMPRAWIVPKAEWMERPEDVIERLVPLKPWDENGFDGFAEKLDFDPRQVVLLDRQVEPAAAEQLVAQRELFSLQGPDQPGRAPAITFDPTNTPERVHLTITNPTDGWLVLADAYMNGWVATVSDAASAAQPAERAILPAYGVLRALPIRASKPSAGQVDRIDVTFEYKPLAWRYGLLASASGAVMVLLMLGFGLRGQLNKDGMQ